MNKIKSAVIGVGHLGRFHAEKYAQLPNTELVAVCDPNTERCHEIATRLNVQAVTDYHDLLGQVDAVSIVSPTSTHHQLAKDFLSNGSHTLVEKPITTTISEADELIEIARKKNLILQVGHIERFNPAYLALKRVLQTPLFIEAKRLAPFKPRITDVDVILDLMIHDIDLVQHLAQSPIRDIQAIGGNVLTQRTDIANARITFENNCVANITASRVNFTTQRKLHIFQSDAFINANLQTKTLRIERKGNNETLSGIPGFTSETQSFAQGDALMDEIAAFLNSIETKTPAMISGEDGRNALKTALRITDLIKTHFKDGK